MSARKAAAKARAVEKYPDPPLGRTERERVFLEFEQALICASEAFYRFRRDHSRARWQGT